MSHSMLGSRKFASDNELHKGRELFESQEQRGWEHFSPGPISVESKPWYAVDCGIVVMH